MSARSRRSRGAALLTALVIVSVIATVASAMVWQQWRAVQVEAAERARAQSSWILAGALDWARLLLREDFRADGNKRVDGLGEPWATPLAEARLSTFLAAEEQVTEDLPDAFLSGRIVEAQSRFNLANLMDGRTPNPTWIAALQRLCETVGVSAEVAARIVAGMQQATPLVPGGPTGGASNPPAETSAATTPLMPQTPAQLAWFGIEPEAIRALEPFVILLPGSDKTQVNVNTAPREVLIAAIAGLDAATAERIIQTRQRKPYESVIPELKASIGGNLPDPAFATCDVKSEWFEVHGRMRLDSVVLEQKSLVSRKNLRDITVVRRERVSSVDAASQPVEK